MKPFRYMAEALHYSLVEPSRQEPRVLLLAMATMLMTMGQGMVGPILPLLVKSFGMAAVMVGVAVSVFALAGVFANIPAAMLARFRGARFVLVAAALFSAVGNLMVGIISDYAALVAFRFVAGVGFALFITAAVLFVAEVSTPENRGRLMTLFQAAFLLGISLGPAVGGITAELFGLAAPFYLVALVSLASGAWALAKIPANVVRAPQSSASPGSHQQAPERSGSHSLLRNWGYVAVSMIALATSFTRGGALFNLWPLLGKERYALGPGPLGLLFTVPAVVNLVCQPLVGALVDRLGRKALLVPTMFVFSASLLLSTVPLMGAFILALALYGIAQAVEGPAGNSYVADIVAPKHRAMALGIYRTFGDVGMVVGSPLLGLIADIVGIPWGLVVNAILLLIPGMLFLIVAKETGGRRVIADSVERGRGA